MIDAEEYVAKLVAQNTHIFPCGHVDLGEAGCSGCADEREAEERAEKQVVAAYEALCPIAETTPKVGLLKKLYRKARRKAGLV